MTELQKRVVTASAGAIALILVIIYGDGIGIFLIATALSLLMVDEFAKMVYTMPDREEKRYVLLFLAWIIGLGAWILAHTEFELLVFSFLALFTYYLVTARKVAEDLTGHFKELMFSIFGLLYLALLPTYLPKIHGSAHGVHWTIVFLLVNWGTDTGAYFAGRKYGKTPFYPLISPKKTREGAYGGLATAFAATLVYKLVLFHAMPWAGVIIVPPLVSAVAQLGDLAESFMKRAFHCKDSGSILPGHGGFLDRFDGVVFSLPIMYACIRIFS